MGLKRRRATLLVAMLVVALVAAACGDDDGGGAGETTTTAGAEETTTTAAAEDGGEETTTTAGEGAAAEVTVGDDGRLVPAQCPEGENVADESVGVTEDSVNIAIIGINYGPLADLGFAAPGAAITELLPPFIDAVNDAGGVCGRTLDVDLFLYDILRNEGPQACVRATEDRNNLIVLGQGGFQEIVCVAEAGTIAYTQHDLSEAEVEASGGPDGLLFSRVPSIDDQYRATVQWLLDEGLLEGKKVGVWYGSVFLEHGDAVESIVLPALDEAGIEHIDFRTDFLGPSDPQGNAVLLAAASEFAAQRVDVVLNLAQTTNHVGMQTEMQARSHIPQWLSAPILTNTANAIFANTYQTQEIADGEQILSYAYAVNELGPETSPTVESCVAQYTEATGVEPEQGSFDYNSVANACVQIDMVVAALSLAGPELNQQTMIAALESLPPHDSSPMIGKEGWAPGERFPTRPMFGVHTYDGASNSYTTSGIFELAE